MGAQRRWDELYTLASEQGGYFTTRQAESVAFSDQLLEHHLASGRLQRAQRGIYRLTHYPLGDTDDLIVLWLWSRQQGIFSHITALALHHLSDALPSRYHLTVPKSWRGRRLRTPENLDLHYDDLPASERTWFGCVPLTTVQRTLEDCRNFHLSEELLQHALVGASQRGLLA